MAQYFFDPNDWTVGDNLSTPGFPFSLLLGSFATVEIQNDGTSNYLYFDCTTSGRTILAYTPAGTATDIETYSSIASPNNNAKRQGIRATAANGGSFYQIRNSSIDTVVDGSLTAISSFGILSGKTRFRARGTNPTSIKAKSWSASNPEPSVWDAELDNSEAALQSPGYAALVPFSQTASIYGYGVGTNGSPAPTGPVTPVSLAANNIGYAGADLSWSRG